jgi:hypothetical protein
LEKLGIPEGHFSVLSGIHGKDPRPKEAMPGQLDQSGIPTFPNDLLIDLPGLVGVHDFAAQLFATLVEGESVEDGIGRKRIEIIGLTQGTAVGLEPLIHHNRSDIPLHFHPNL